MNISPWALLAGIAALLAVGTGAVEAIRADAVAGRDREIAAASEKLRSQESIRAAENAVRSEHDALAAEAEAAARDRLVDELNTQIAELERTNAKCGYVSRATVRALNSSH